jgi:hypothetical protein
VNIEETWKEDPEWAKTWRDKMVRNMELPKKVWIGRNFKGEFSELFVQKGELWDH